MIGLFADVGNLFHNINKRFPGRKLDYRKLLPEECKATAYGTQLNKEASVFITCLQHIGYDVRYRQINRGDRTSWNVGITLDIMDSFAGYETIIICSADPELMPLLTWLKEKGVQVLVQACNIPPSFHEVADCCEISEQDLEVR